MTLATPAGASDHRLLSTALRRRAATTYPDVEVHANEKVAIAAEPYDTKEKAKIFRVDYLAHGVMPIRLIITNNGDRPISLRDARISSRRGRRPHPGAEPEDVERLMTRKEQRGRNRYPCPARCPAFTPRRRLSNKDIEADFAEFEYGALVVEPHTTRAGFLFYDVSELNHPLQGAKLHLAQGQRCRRE